MAEQSETVQRLINIELKINTLLSSVKAPLSFDNFDGHSDQAFGRYSYAQHGEDMIIANIFYNLHIERPSYIDIGAHHPINISNTALLYKRGSRGVNIEANPNLFDAFLKYKPEDINLNIGVGAQEGSMPFYLIDKWSGRNTFDKHTADEFVRLHPEFKILETMDIPVKTVPSVISEHCGGKFPDFMSIDVEGLDYDILKTIDFSKSRPKVICAEVISGANDDNTGNIATLLVSAGYKPYIATVGNIIFVADEAYNVLKI